MHFGMLRETENWPIWYQGGILRSAATLAKAPVLEDDQMPLVRLGPHICNPFPSLTLDGLS